MRTSFSAQVKKHRAVLRESSLRPVQIGVPDTRRVGLAEECRRQSLLLRDDVHEQEMTNWLDHLADRDGWQ